MSANILLLRESADGLADTIRRTQNTWAVVTVYLKPITDKIIALAEANSDVEGKDTLLLSTVRSLDAQQHCFAIILLLYLQSSYLPDGAVEMFVDVVLDFSSSLTREQCTECANEG
jgi:hypothetical protein